MSTQVDLKEGMVVNLVKVSEKDAKTSADSTDILPLSDANGNISKITVNNLLSPVSGGVGNAITTTFPANGVNTYNVQGGAGTYSNFFSAAATPIVFDNTADSMATKNWQMRKVGTYWQKYEIKSGDLSIYTLNGGSSKTMKDIDDEIYRTGVNHPAYQFGITIGSPSLNVTNSICYVQKGYTVPYDSKIDTVNVVATATGTLDVVVFRLVSTTYTEVSRTSVSVVSGSNAVTVNIPVLAGDKLGMITGASVTFKYSNSAVTYASNNVLTAPITFAQSNLDNPATGSTATLGFNFHIAAVNIEPGIKEQIEDINTALADTISEAELDAFADTVVKDSDLILDIGKNKFDKATMILVNKLIDNTGALITVAGAKMCRIPVTVGQTYTFFQSQYAANSGGQIRLVDSGLGLVSTFAGSTLSADSTGTGKKITIPTGVAYIEINIYYSTTGYTDMTNTLQFEIGTGRTNYEAFTQIVSKINGLNIKATGTKPYYDLNLFLLGDSITWLAPPQSWVAYMLDRIDFKSVTNVARSGATWSHTAGTVYDITSTGGSISDDNVIWNQFNRIKAGITAGTMPVPDLIVIPAGTNDFSRTIGSVATTFTPGSSIIGNAANTILSVTDAVRYDVELMLAEWPNVQIILVTPIQRGISDNTTIRNIADAIEGCADRLALECIRMDKHSGIYGYNEISSHIFLYDGLHPNSVGAPKMGKRMAAELINKICA